MLGTVTGGGADSRSMSREGIAMSAALGGMHDTSGQVENSGVGDI